MVASACSYLFWNSRSHQSPDICQTRADIHAFDMFECSLPQSSKNLQEIEEDKMMFQLSILSSFNQTYLLRAGILLHHDIKSRSPPVTCHLKRCLRPSSRTSTTAVTYHLSGTSSQLRFIRKPRPDFDS